MKRPHITLLVAFGPEVRAFVHSGLLQSLLERYRVTIVTWRPQSKAFINMPVPVLPMPEALESAIVARARYWARQIHEAWLSTHDYTRWRHYILEPHQKNNGITRFFRRFLAQLPFLCTSALSIVRWYINHFGTSPVWRSFFIENDVQALITSSFASVRTLPALQTASSMGLKTIVVTNSWKDVYSTPYIQVVPDRLIVWNEQVKSDLLLFNPYIPSSQICISDSLHLASFFGNSTLMSFEELCRTSGLDPQRPYICYTAASPVAVVNEELIIEAILQAIEDGTIPGKPQLLLRLNPMEDGGRFSQLASQYPNLVIQTPQWEWDQKADWCCALPEDTSIWVTTVRYARVNVSIPSTVTLEFASVQRPVVNVCFDLPSDLPKSQSNRRFWEADFYTPIRRSRYAYPAFSREEMIHYIAYCLQGNVSVPDPAPLFSFPWENPVKRVRDIVDDVMGL